MLNNLAFTAYRLGEGVILHMRLSVSIGRLSFALHGVVGDRGLEPLTFCV